MPLLLISGDIIKPLGKSINLGSVVNVDRISQAAKPLGKAGSHFFKFVISVTSFNFNILKYSFVAVVVAVADEEPNQVMRGKRCFRVDMRVQRICHVLIEEIYLDTTVAAELIK